MCYFDEWVDDLDDVIDCCIVVKIECCVFSVGLCGNVVEVIFELL